MKILLFGASGTAGGGVLGACLASPRVESVRAVTRRPLPDAGARLESITHHDFLDFTAIATAFARVDAGLFCLGKSVTQVGDEAEYRRITRDFAMAAARTLHTASPAAVFHYVSGHGAALDSSRMWARVKAEAESELIDTFGAVCWRPAAIDGEPSPSSPGAYRFIRPLYPLLRRFRGLYITAEDIGRAMLQATAEKQRAVILENAAIRDLADRSVERTGPAA